ncbi:putative B3 domain-containing protein Os03g0621600 isoform X1 [Cicer arietinum]|uniref:B3 domain-containing protein Os03g0621600 isoform X1 n=2 Tax=Cicer arietinum TaxID=3827 RepID=A0A3Q7X8N3_CICAR|nr:putative B3 domain-containing protein Os03g0621600 isoform X1 [Cicer arietinum]
MQPRQSCVRSSAAEEKKKSKHFMKAILPSPIHATQLRIPDEFITRFGNELNNVTTITVPDGCIWKITLNKCGKDVFFQNNWQEFTEYYSIGYGSYLDFKYKGKSKFNVIIFDSTSVEICYPSTNEEPNIKCPRKISKVETSDKNHGTEFNSASKRAKDAAFFRSTFIKNRYPYVHSDFASKYLKPNVPFKLQNCHGQQWKVFCALQEAGKSAMRITRGFRKFARENNLSCRKEYEFKLIKRKPVVVLQVTTSCTPCRRRCVGSSVEKEVRESKHFKKAILPSPFHANKIRIPDEFIKRFGNELNNVATIMVPDGRVWEIGLENCDEDVFFCNNWREFSEYYSIEYGCYLTFKYKGNSKFSVVIFDATSVEICYPFKDANEEPNTKCLSDDSVVEINDATDLPSENQVSKNPSFKSTIKARRLVSEDFSF